MPTLPTELRNKLERVVIEARDAAEAGARAALEALAVHHHEPYPHMKPSQRALRNHLRARARQLGDRQDSSGRLAIDHLAGECAYEHWHRMLFARFLAENNLLIEPDTNMPISLAEAEELARVEAEAASSRLDSDKRQDAASTWVFASRCAQQMLPQIFRPDDPLLQVSFATEHMLKLERLLASLPAEVFTASDALGWVYQFWQSKKKDEVNRSEVKIGADELPAVTQLFTEPYMVQFLLHNTLGAWWAGKVAAASSRWSSFTTEAEARQACALPGLSWDYLRFIKVEAASSRLDSEKRQDAASTLRFYDKDDPVEKTAANLPHWRQEGVIYFVTFRTADSLPQERLQQWLKEKQEWLAAHPEPRDEEATKEYFERFPERIEYWLDQGYGACHLMEPAIREIVQDALKHFDGRRYTLDEYAIAANHVHVLVTPKDGHELSDILHSWKSFTANQINKHLGQSGTFWQKESFDHIVRSEVQLERIRAYIRNHEQKRQSGSGFQPLAADPQEKRQDAASTLRPAAGTFDGWPKAARDIKILDPCCGSGHFLVAALHHLVPIRMAEEGLSAREAVDAVLRDNLHGLEIDERCCQIAAFALALEAWKISGWKPLPPLNIACTGIGPQCSAEQWIKLAEQSSIPMPAVGREAIKNGLLNLHRLFSQAPTLGSLINPAELPADLIAADYETIQPYLAAVLKAEKADDETRERAIAAAGMVKAADLLAGEYTLVITNVPYLGRGKQDDVLKAHLERFYDEGRADLATACLLRCLECCTRNGTTALVIPQACLYLPSFGDLRHTLLEVRTWNLIARLGPGAFETITGHVVNVALAIMSAMRPNGTSEMAAIDVSDAAKAADKAELLSDGHPSSITQLKQSGQLRNPSCGISFEVLRGDVRIGDIAYVGYGSKPGQTARVTRYIWEFDRIDPDHWTRMASTPDGVADWSGRAEVCLSITQIEEQEIREFGVRGAEAWGKRGVIYSKMTHLPASLYDGEFFDDNTNVIVPSDMGDVSAFYAYMKAGDFNRDLRRVNRKLNVTRELVQQFPIDLAHWQKVAAEKYRDGLPEPESDDPTQWLFHGRPDEAQEGTELQVAVARLLGYRWPAELDDKLRLSRRARALVKKCGELANFADNDGIVCVPAVRGEEPAAEQLRRLLAAAYGDQWSAAMERQLIRATGSTAADLDEWLRNDFFEQHCKLFHDRPFIWHIWDGRKRDGFHALVNYHKLCGSGFQPLAEEKRQDAASTVQQSGSGFQPLAEEKRQDAASTRGRRLLESLTYAYLGEWITRQKDGVKRGEGGAEDRLAAAVGLQKRLEAILEGEPPFDIFVRWKPLHEQPIGWEPDINDGVRMNIRPFLASDLPGGRTGAGILRFKPNIKWTKDRGKEPDRPKEEYPWFWGWDEKTVDFAGGKTFDGNRWNDCHYTNQFKQAARERKAEG
jgi:REP element-mobilizing transposase RayT